MNNNEYVQKKHGFKKLRNEKQTNFNIKLTKFKIRVQVCLKVKLFKISELSAHY